VARGDLCAHRMARGDVFKAAMHACLMCMHVQGCNACMCLRL